jgi:hypothetical protein
MGRENRRWLKTVKETEGRKKKIYIFFCVQFNCGIFPVHALE